MKTVLRSLILLFCLTTCLHASAIIWQDDFSAPDLNPHFSKRYSVNHDGSGHLVISTATATNFGGSFLYTQKDQNGSFNSGDSGVYDFFSRPISIKLTGLTLSGTPTVDNHYNFYMMLGTPVDNSPLNLTPRNDFSGAFVRVSYGEAGTTLYVGDRLINGKVATTSYLLASSPSSIEFTVDGAEWTLTIGGATFDADGTTSQSGTFSQITSDSLGDSPYFAMGIINYDTLPAGSVPYEISLSSLEITSIPEPSVAHITALGLLFVGFWTVLKRRKAHA